MADYVKKYTCGSCDYYEFEGENKKGYCEYYKRYYYPDDSCKKWVESTSSSSGGGCFITTACCEYKGFPDDCKELQTLRQFRDTYLKEQDYGMELIQLYYADAPKIVDAINSSDSKEKFYDDIYNKVVDIVKLIDDKMYDKAVIEYMIMVYNLRKMVEVN